MQVLQNATNPQFFGITHFTDYSGGGPAAVQDPQQADTQAKTEATALAMAQDAMQVVLDRVTPAATPAASLASPQSTPLAADQPTAHIPPTNTHVAQAHANTYTLSDPSPSTTDVGLSMVGQSLNLAHAIGGLAPVHGLREAAEIALVILDGVKKARKNKDDFERIGKQCLTLVEIIKMRVDSQTAGEQLGTDVYALVDALVAIKGYVIKFNSRSWPRRFFFAWVDIDVVQECRNQLAFAVTQFHVKSFISLRQDVEYMRDILDLSQRNTPQSRRAERKRYRASERRAQEIKAAHEVATALEVARAQEVAAIRAFARALVAAQETHG